MPEVAPVIRAVLEVRVGRSDSFSRRGVIVVGVVWKRVVMMMTKEGGKGGKGEKGVIYSAVLQGHRGFNP